MKVLPKLGVCGGGGCTRCGNFSLLIGQKLTVLQATDVCVSRTQKSFFFQNERECLVMFSFQ